MSLGKRTREGVQPISSSPEKRVRRKLNPISPPRKQERSTSTTSILRTASRYTKSPSSAVFQPPKHPLATISPNQLHVVSPSPSIVSKTRPTSSVSSSSNHQDEDDHDDICSVSSSESSSSSTEKQTRFYNKVVVVRIPSRYQYPQEMKKTIWSSMKEINENAKRNTIEFASDGWNWRKATEDHAFYQNSATGELVHPVHVMIHNQKKKQRQQQQRREAERAARLKAEQNQHHHQQQQHMFSVRH